MVSILKLISRDEMKKIVNVGLQKYSTVLYRTS